MPSTNVNPNANYLTLPGGTSGTVVTGIQNDNPKSMNLGYQDPNAYSGAYSKNPLSQQPTPQLGNITSNTLSNQPPLQMPQQPAPQDYISPLAGIKTTIDGINDSITKIRDQQNQQTAPSNSLESLMQQYLSSNTAPPSAADQYNADYNASGIADKQANALASQNKLDAINAQLQGKNYELNTLIPNKAMQDANGQNGTQAGVQATTVSQQRQKLLEIAPLQLQALVTQAEVTGNNNLLNAAQSHLDTVYKIHQQDAQAQYQLQSDNRKAVYDFATKQEQARLDAQQKTADQNFTQQQNDLNNAQDIAKAAIQNGQGDIAAKITALDPKSPTYRQDVAKYAGMIQDNSAALDRQYKQAQIDKIYSDMNATSQNGGLLAQTNTRQTTSGINYVDGTNLTGKDATQAQTFAAQNGIPYLDKTSADLQNNVETARQNMQNIQSSLDGLLPTSGLNVTAKLSNLLQSSTQVGPNADALASFNAYRSAAIQALRAMAGAKGLRINQAEIMQSVNNDIPKITDTVGVAKAKIAIVNGLLDSQEKGTFGSKFYKPSGTNSTNTPSSTSAVNPLGI